MKKIMIFSLLVASLSFAACDPIEDREEMTGSITVDQIQATVTVEQIDGHSSDKGRQRVRAYIWPPRCDGKPY